MLRKLAEEATKAELQLTSESAKNQPKMVCPLIMPKSDTGNTQRHDLEEKKAPEGTKYMALLREQAVDYYSKPMRKARRLFVTHKVSAWLFTGAETAKSVQLLHRLRERGRRRQEVHPEGTAHRSGSLHSGHSEA